jgi:hypothetical protein
VVQFIISPLIRQPIFSASLEMDCAAITEERAVPDPRQPAIRYAAEAIESPEDSEVKKSIVAGQYGKTRNRTPCLNEKRIYRNQPTRRESKVLCKAGSLAALMDHTKILGQS